LQVPPGSWRLDGFAWDGGLLDIGGADVTVFADSVTIVDVVVGRDDGVD
jgi:hypothetical protein